MELHQWRRGDLVDQGIPKDRLSKWLRGEEVPKIDMIRRVCSILDVPAVDGMVAAGHLRAEDVGATVVRLNDARELTDRALLDELAERLAERAGTEEDTASGKRPTATPRHLVPVVRPEGRRGTDWAARPREE